MTDNLVEKTLTRKEILTGNVIHVVVDEVELPNHEKGQREIVLHPGAVAIMALTSDKKMLFVRQFRKPLERTILEIPAGKIDPEDTDTLATAKRELEEETGYQGEKWQFVAEYATSPGFSNEIMHTYLATDLVKVEDPLAQDEDEFLQLVAYTLEEAKAGIKQGEIYDAKTIMAIQTWQAMTESGEL
ncbi:NUDIX hydrolase [Vagococcus humatus]|uniref:ADP-ribose pyrophosphatase n=1 Tax=Vagococcus humatus TaxID=1889241 RepID=A0A3S0ABN9_9ENTE|nr:NUDIX hydrolase [Vagococcus humatus]RST89119.1 ADP-ribose pyrophosphatase [Vagococcus humatus]